MGESELREVYAVFGESWKFLKGILQEYPNISETVLSDEQWETIVEKTATRVEEYNKTTEAEAIRLLFRHVLGNCVTFVENKDKEAKEKCLQSKN